LPPRRRRAPAGRRDVGRTHARRPDSGGGRLSYLDGGGRQSLVGCAASPPGRSPLAVHAPSLWRPGALRSPGGVRSGRRLSRPAVDGGPRALASPPTRRPDRDGARGGTGLGAEVSLPAHPLGRADAALPAVLPSRRPAAGAGTPVWRPAVEGNLAPLITQRRAQADNAGHARA